METTPVSLLRRLNDAPQEEDWRTLVELCTPLLLSWAKSVGLSEAAAADLAQDVLLTLFAEMPRFQYDETRSFRRWLKTVTLNKWRSAQRRRGAQELVSLEAAPDVTLDEDPAAAFWESEFQERLVARAMEIIEQRFDAKTWAACRQTLMEGRAAQAVAVELGMTVAAVYQAKSRVLRILREELEGLLD